MTFTARRRDHVLQVLKTRGEASLGEVAEALGVSKPGALRHLTHLQEEGLVIGSVRRTPLRGRPEHLYSLSPAADSHFPKAYRELALDLVKLVEPARLEAYFEGRATELETSYKERLQGLDHTARVHELARLSAEHGHMSEVGRNEVGDLTIIHHNCPIADVALQTGLPCQAEQGLYRRLLGGGVERLTRIPDGSSGCTYQLKATSKG